MPAATFEQQLDILGSLREPTRRRLYEYVQRQSHAVSREEVASAAGISRALAAFHLDKLVRVGLLRAEYRRISDRSGPGAGRSSKLYRRSRLRFGISVPPRDHELLARLLAAASGAPEAVGPEIAPAREYGRLLGRRARRRVRGQADAERLLKCVEDVLESLSFDPYRGPGLEVRVRNCPFDPLSRLFTPVVCGVAQSIVVGILEGVETEEIHVARDEHPERCCLVLTTAGASEA